MSSKVYFKIPNKFRPPLVPTKDVITMADGECKLGIFGTVKIPVRVYDTRFEFEMTVVNMDSMVGIWGMDFLAQFWCDFKTSSKTFVFMAIEYPRET
jgi:hypothetical protein